MRENIVAIVVFCTLVCVFVGWFWLIYVFVGSKSFRKKKWNRVNWLEIVLIASYTILLRRKLTCYFCWVSTSQNSFRRNFVNYGTPCHTIGHFVFWYHHASGHLVIYRECYGSERAFFTLRCFLHYTPSCWFQGNSGAGISTLKLVGLHADIRNIVPARLFVWITTIHKRSMVAGSI